MRTWPTLAFSSLLVSTLGCQPPENPFLVPEPEECTVDAQKDWVVDVLREFYLWNQQLPGEIDLAAYETPEDLVAELRQEPDRWTRIADKVKSDALFMEGKFVGLGFKTERLDDDSIRFSFVSDNSPASGASFLRGDKLVAVGGYTVAELDEQSLWGSIYGADEPGVSVEMTIEKLATGEQETHVLTKAWIDIVSVPVVEVFEGPGARRSATS
ncbi:MAG: hypothetical protein HC927_02120 [Deltaproteobacteria bacterium]|nr:hypothetical protein [Deltaproteobacteria bacterium]